VVVHGLELVERPNMRPEDAEWFVISCPWLCLCAM
jgi:hypothetical protein